METFRSHLHDTRPRGKYVALSRLCDLHFAFECDDNLCEDYERFSEIMGSTA
jgi:hypothetical protein